MSQSSVVEEFVNRLSNVTIESIHSEDRACCICLQGYGTQPSDRGILEHPVRLPGCAHIMGSECIRLWLSPGNDGENRHNSCPACRTIVFPLAPLLTTEEFLNTNFDHMFAPVRERRGRFRLEHLDPAEFEINDREQYLRLRVSTPRIGTPASGSDSLINHGCRVEGERSHYYSLLSRDRTLSQVEGNGELSPQQVGVLFDDLERQGAFNKLWGSHVGGDRNEDSATLPTRQQIWHLMRDCGFSYQSNLRAEADEDELVWLRLVWRPRDGAHQDLSPWTD